MMNSPCATSGTVRRRLRVYVIDDDADARELLQVTLEDCGYEVEAYGDPREALLRMRAGSAPELVIIDLKMPHMTGRELLQALGAHAYLRTIPALVVTAFDVGPIPRAVATLRKPIRPEVLVAHVERCVSQMETDESGEDARESATER